MPRPSRTQAGEEVSLLLSEAARNGGLYMILSSPKTGVTKTVTDSLRKFAIEDAKQPETSHSDEMNAWNAAFQKYHGSGDRSAGGAPKAAAYCRPLGHYVDLRGVFQKPLLLLMLAESIGIPFPETQEVLEQGVKDALTRNDLPFNTLVLDHVSLEAARVLVSLLDFASLPFGTVMICSLVIDLLEVVNDISLTDILQCAPTAIDHLEEQMQTSLHQFAKLLHRAPCSSVDERLLVHSPLISTRELRHLVQTALVSARPDLAGEVVTVEAHADLVVEVAVGLPGLALGLMHMSMEGLRHISSALHARERQPRAKLLSASKMSSAAFAYAHTVAVYHTIAFTPGGLYCTPVIELLDAVQLQLLASAGDASNRTLELGLEAFIVQELGASNFDNVELTRLGLLAPLTPSQRFWETASNASERSVSKSTLLVAPQYLVALLMMQPHALPKRTLGNNSFYQSTRCAAQAFLLARMERRFALTINDTGIASSPPDLSTLWRMQLLHSALFAQLRSAAESKVTKDCISLLMLLVADSMLPLFASVYDQMQLLVRASEVETEILLHFSVNDASFTEHAAWTAITFVSAVQDCAMRVQANLYSSWIALTPAATSTGDATFAEARVALQYALRLGGHLEVMVSAALQPGGSLQVYHDAVRHKLRAVDALLSAIDPLFGARALPTVAPTLRHALHERALSLQSALASHPQHDGFLRPVVSSVVSAVVAFCVTYDNLLAHQSPRLLYDLLVDDNNAFYGLHRHMLVLQASLNPFWCNLSVLDYYILLRRWDGRSEEEPPQPPLALTSPTIGDPSTLVFVDVMLPLLRELLPPMEEVRAVLVRALVKYMSIDDEEGRQQVLNQVSDAAVRHIDEYTALLLEPLCCDDPTAAHGCFGLAIYLHLLGMAHGVVPLTQRRLLHAEQCLFIHRKYLQSTPHRQLHAVLVTHFVSLTAKAKWQCRDVDLLVSELTHQRTCVLEELHLLSRQRAQIQLGQPHADHLAYVHRQQVCMVRTLFSMQNCLRVAAKSMPPLRAIKHFQALIGVYQANARAIDDILLDQSFSTRTPSDAYNPTLAVADLFVDLAQSLYAEATRLAGSHKYCFQDASSSILPPTDLNTDPSLTSISLQLYHAISRLFKYACYLYDSELPPARSAPRLLSTFRAIIRVLREQGLWGLCKIYYDNILKVCTEVQCMGPEDIIHVYRGYGQVLMLNQDFDEAVVIYSLVGEEYNNLAFRHCWQLAEVDPAEPLLLLSSGSGKNALPPPVAPSAGSGKDALPPSVTPSAGSGKDALPPPVAPSAGSGKDALPSPVASSAGSGKMELLSTGSGRFDQNGVGNSPKRFSRIPNPSEWLHKDPKVFSIYHAMLECQVARAAAYVGAKNFDDAEEQVLQALQRFLQLYAEAPLPTSDSEPPAPVELAVPPTPTASDPPVTSTAHTGEVDEEAPGPAASSDLNLDLPLLHALAVAHVDTDNVEVLVRAISLLATLFYESQEYPEALIIYHIAFQLLLVKLGAEPEGVELRVCESADQATQALDIYDRVVIPELEAKEIAVLLQNVGMVLLAMGRADLGKDMLEKALAIILRRFPDEFLMMLSVAEALEAALREMEQDQDADELQQFSVGIEAQLQAHARDAQDYRLQMEATVDSDPSYDLDWGALVGGMLVGLSKDDEDDDEDEDKGGTEVITRRRSLGAHIDEEAALSRSSSTGHAGRAPPPAVDGWWRLVYPSAAKMPTPLQLASQSLKLETGFGVSSIREGLNGMRLGPSRWKQKEEQARHVAASGYDSDTRSDTSDAESRRQAGERGSRAAAAAAAEDFSSGCVIA